MLEGACAAVEDFAGSIGAAGAGPKAEPFTPGYVAGRPGTGDDKGWRVADVPATHQRVAVYRDRVLGTFWEVLHCLLEEGGRRDGVGDGRGGNGFYSLGEAPSACRDAFKRNLCCERAADNGSGEGPRGGPSNGDVEGTTPTSDGDRGTGDDGPDGASRGATTRYGNNPLVGDIGDMANLTPQARSDGRELLELLASLLEDLSDLESSASNVLRVMDDKGRLREARLSDEAAGHATGLMRRAGKLRELVSRMDVAPPSPPEADDEGGRGAAGGGAPVDRPPGSIADGARQAAQALANAIDPPPHGSALGLDVVRGTFLARHRGARQLWVARGGGDGELDVVLVPSPAGAGGGGGDAAKPGGSLPLSPRKGRRDGVATPGAGRNRGVGGRRRRAVLYCNPNAGLFEVATGMGLTGGNVVEEEKDADEQNEPTCWTEYYTEHGYDVYLFNYAGYGRSYGRSLGGGGARNGSASEFQNGFLGALKRVLHSTFLAFKPSSESLKSDAAAVARHLVDVVGVDELIIHGESIGGMAAAAAARALTAAETPTAPGPSVVLICDRTFCNLEAVAQRLVGSWTGGAIRLLAPTWGTDVARDFLEARCPKVAANDCSDEIIHDYSSLKTGLAFARELTGGRTEGLGRTTSAPLEHRMADVDGVGAVAGSRVAGGGGGGPREARSPPTWPANEHVSWSEAHHYAACVKRIGKLATAAKRQMRASLSSAAGAEEGVEVSYASDGESSGTQSSPLANIRSRSIQKESENKMLMKLWNSLACCDGLCGHPLGYAVKEGSDCTIAWLCCAVVFGSQVLAEKAEKRWDKQRRSSSLDASAPGLDDSECVLLPDDFDSRPNGSRWDEDELTRYPLPIPVVLSSLKEMSAQKNALKEVEAELNYVIGMLEYIISRLTSKENSILSLRQQSGRERDRQGVDSTGLFLNLHCGHNNQYSSEERDKLMALICRSCGDPV